MNYLIVGAGLSGCVIAEQLAKNSENRIGIIEKKRHIGGTCYDHFNKEGILVHDYGPHIFNTHDKKIWDYVNKFSPFIEYFHRVLGYVDGYLVPIPFNLKSIQTVFPRGMSDRICQKLIDKYGYNKKVPILELLNQNDDDLEFLSKYIYEKVFLNYTVKQWGKKPEEVGSSAMARIPVFVSTDDRYFQNPYQGVPKYGYTNMINNMIASENISITLGMNYREVISLDEGKKKVYINGNPFNGQIIFTGCLDELFGYKYGELEYRTLNFEFETIDCDSFQPVATVNYPNNYSFTRITEFKKLTKQSHNKTVIMREFPNQYSVKNKSNDPLYPIPTDENETRYEKYLDEVRQYSQIVVAGRLANYKYFTMNETISNALRIANDIKVRQ